jgi:hypothetical protein
MGVEVDRMTWYLSARALFGKMVRRLGPPPPSPRCYFSKEWGRRPHVHEH